MKNIFKTGLYFVTASIIIACGSLSTNMRHGVIQPSQNGKAIPELVSSIERLNAAARSGGKLEDYKACLEQEGAAQYLNNCLELVAAEMSVQLGDNVTTNKLLLLLNRALSSDKNNWDPQTIEWVLQYIPKICADSEDCHNIPDEKEEKKEEVDQPDQNGEEKAIKELAAVWEKCFYFAEMRKYYNYYVRDIKQSAKSMGGLVPFIKAELKNGGDGIAELNRLLKIVQLPDGAYYDSQRYKECKNNGLSDRDIDSRAKLQYHWSGSGHMFAQASPTLFTEMLMYWIQARYGIPSELECAGRRCPYATRPHRHDQEVPVRSSEGPRQKAFRIFAAYLESKHKFFETKKELEPERSLGHLGLAYRIHCIGSYDNIEKIKDSDVIRRFTALMNLIINYQADLEGNRGQNTDYWDVVFSSNIGAKALYEPIDKAIEENHWQPKPVAPHEFQDWENYLLQRKSRLKNSICIT